MQGVILIVALGALGVSAGAEPAPPALIAPLNGRGFELKPGDRVALIGSTFVEREGRYGFIEAALTAHYPDHDVIFRNLGWSGDTVFGHARSYFDPPEAGFNRLTRHLQDFKPTVAIVCYGWSESWGGEAGLPAFLSGLDRLAKVLEKAGARVYFASPLPDEPGVSPGRAAEHNKQLAHYRDAMKKFASERGSGFADFFEALGSGEAKRETPLTDNGVHMTEQGYGRATPLIGKALGISPVEWAITINVAKPSSTTSGTALSELAVTTSGVSFTARDTALPLSPAGLGDASEDSPKRVLKIVGLKGDGKYSLSIGSSRNVATATASQWATGVAISRGPEFGQAAQLRTTIVQKNEFFFHRWRPANETYIFGFRKGEQGRNSVEMPKFDPLIVQKEASIAKLRVPEPQRYELSLEEPRK